LQLGTKRIPNGEVESLNDGITLRIPRSGWG
jgi:hypothetical protein